MFSYKFYPNPENFTPSRMVWMVTFSKSEPELVVWRKVEVKKDNRIVKALTKYWDHEGKEFTYQEVKKMLAYWNKTRRLYQRFWSRQ